jgi:hypothetical protein
MHEIKCWKGNMRQIPVYLSVRARGLDSVSGTPPFAQLILGSSGPEVKDSDDTLFTRAHLLCFLWWRWSRWGFSGGVLDFRLLLPLSLVDCSRLLGLVAPFECFVLLLMLPHCCNEAIHLGLGWGHLFFLVLGRWLPPPLASSSCTR